MASDRIRESTLCIGLMPSAQWVRRAAGRLVEARYRELSAGGPLGRIGEESVYADLVAFPASDQAAYIAGTAVNLDGGMAAVV